MVAGLLPYEPVSQYARSSVESSLPVRDPAPQLSQALAVKIKKVWRSVRQTGFTSQRRTRRHSGRRAEGALHQGAFGRGVFEGPGLQREEYPDEPPRGERIIVVAAQHFGGHQTRLRLNGYPVDHSQAIPSWSWWSPSPTVHAIPERPLKTASRATGKSFIRCLRRLFVVYS